MFFPTSPTEELAAAIDVLPGAAVAGVVNRDGVADGVIGTELQISSLTNGPNCHMGSSSPWAYQGRRFAALWRNAKEPKASISAPSVASTLTPRSSAASPPIPCLVAGDLAVSRLAGVEDVCRGSRGPAIR